jgi:16S rRNA (cytosine967-C5)-methyltransferase
MQAPRPEPRIERPVDGGFRGMPQIDRGEPRPVLRHDERAGGMALDEHILEHDGLRFAARGQRDRRGHDASAFDGIAVVVAIDIPSGVDADTGTVAEDAVTADITVTFAYPKVGFLNPAAQSCIGHVVVADIGIHENHPDWLLTRLRADWPEAWADIVAANNRVAPLWLRIPGEAPQREAFSTQLQAQCIAHRISEIASQAIRIDDAMAPTQLPGWLEGRVAVQDLSAQLPAIALAVKAGETVWDMCAAPGGKSAQLLEAAPAMLLLTDNEADRLPKIKELFARLGFAEDAAALHTLDATQALPETLPQQFDAILLDAPCSATGIIRRQPDVKWHRREKDIGALNTLQWRLLKNAWRHLRPGGRLLYSTCSVLKAENESLIAQFLQQHADAKALPLDARFGRVSGVGRQRMPGEDDGDGFFYALLERNV